MTGSDQQRVVGWMSLVLQTYPRGPLSAATRTQFNIGDRGQIVVAWRGGPTAPQVAARLTDTADPDMPVTARETALPDTVVSVRLWVGTVPVLLEAHEPNPEHSRVPVGQPEECVWPRPLHTEGAAEHIVVWTAAPDGDTGAALVIETPVGMGRGDVHWTESGHLVVDANMHFDEHTAEITRRRWERHREHAVVLLRASGDDTTVEDADRWLIEQQEHGRIRAPFVAGVCWPDQTCLLRVAGPRMGWRVTARPYRRPYSTAALLPAVVLDAINHDPRRRPPTTLSVQRFGNAHSEQHWVLDAEPVAPRLQP